jgi:hypothetical protein
MASDAGMRLALRFIAAPPPLTGFTPTPSSALLTAPQNVVIPQVSSLQNVVNHQAKLNEIMGKYTGSGVTPLTRQCAITIQATTLMQLPDKVLNAHYLKQGSELDLKSRRITNLAEPTHPQDAATLNYVNSVLARKKLASQLFISSRTTTAFELNLSDTAGPTLEFVFTFYTQADENMSCIARKSTHIVSANEASDPINRKEFINLIAYNRQHEIVCHILYEICCQINLNCVLSWYPCRLSFDLSVFIKI